MLAVMTVWIQKSPGCELSVFLSSSPPTTYHFLQIPHFLTSIKHCISFLHITKFLPAPFYLFLHHLSSLLSYLFSLSLFMSPLYIWGTKCRTYRLSAKEDVVLGYRLLLRLHKLWNIHYVMKSFVQMFEIIIVKTIDIYFLICRRIILVQILDFFVGLWLFSANFYLGSLSILHRTC